MVARTLAQVTGLADPGVEDAPVTAWDFRECADGCGTVFLGPAGRTRCLVCRTEAQVTRLGRGRDEDDLEGESEMRQPLADQADVRKALEAGVPAPQVCRDLGLTPVQFVQFCARHLIRAAGVPPSPVGKRFEAFAAEVAAPVAVLPPDADLEADRRAVAAAAIIAAEQAAVAVVESVAAVSAHTEPEEAPAVQESMPVSLSVPTAAEVFPVPAPASPFRAPVREGGIVLGVRVEGSRIVLQEIAVEGNITDVEAELALAWLRGRLADRPGVVVEVEAS